MSVVARMYVSGIARRAWNKDAAEIELNVATRGEENKKWAAATPSGSAKFQINNEAATEVFAEAFEKDLDVMVTFEAVPRPLS